MNLGQIAAIIAAVAFAVLTLGLLYPLIRLGRMFDSLSRSIEGAANHAIPTLDESATTMKELTKTMSDVNKITDKVGYTTENVSALIDLYTSVLGKPVIKIMSIFFSLKRTAQDFMARKKKQQSSSAESDALRKGK